jgi:hypothetical protein
MSYEALTPPIITIQFESMKHAIMQHMALHTKEMQATLDVELTKAIEAFDLSGYVQRIVKSTLEEQIKKAVERNLYDLIYRDEGFNKEINHMIADSVRDVFNKKG